MAPPARSSKIPSVVCRTLRIQALTSRGLLSGPDGTVEGFVEIADPTDPLVDEKHGVRVVRRGRSALLSIATPAGEQSIELFARTSPRGSGNPRWNYRCRCGAAATVLYLPLAIANHWACRKCWDIAYPSQLPASRYSRRYRDQFDFAADFEARYGAKGTGS